MTQYELNLLRRIVGDGECGDEYTKGSDPREDAFSKLSDLGYITIEYSDDLATRKMTVTHEGVAAIRAANRLEG